MTTENEELRATGTTTTTTTTTTASTPAGTTVHPRPDPPDVTTPPDVTVPPGEPGTRGLADRLRFWRSPSDQPAWARPALLTVAGIAALLYAWNITTSGYAPYYSIAVKSATVSWRAMLFGALDPDATITIDKLAGAFVPQAISARLFGYHAWTLTLPQVIEGVVAVLVMYRLGRRWLAPALGRAPGAVVGLLAAALFVLTPVVASLFGHPMADGLLTMCLVLAADAFLTALAGGSLGWLVLAGVWVGVGFQAKMLQAWVVLPAMAVAYLLAASGSLRQRIGRLVIAGAATLAVSVSWLLLYVAVPAGHRPYVDGSTNDNPFSMAFGYNGFSRLRLGVPGAVDSVLNLPNETRFVPTGAQTWTKLINEQFGPQAAWLYPLALLGLVLGLLRHRARRAAPGRSTAPTSPRRPAPRRPAPRPLGSRGAGSCCGAPGW